MSSPCLSLERKTFEQLRPGLLREHRGQYALIRNGDLLGIHETADRAFQEAMDKIGPRTTFLIERISEEQPELVAPALALGLLDAKLP